MFIGQLKAMQNEPGAETKAPETAQSTETVRSSTSDEFLKTPEAKEFVNRLADKLKDGHFPATKRGITDMLGTIHRNSNLSDKEVMKETERVLLRLGGLDGFTGALSKMKAATEGLVKGLKQALGGG